MLTPIEIQGKVFKSGIGYDKKDVDAFFREVLINYETLYKENVELTDKISVLSDGIQHYKTIEKTIQNALILAEKTADETKETAKIKAEAIEKEAFSKAKLIVAEAKHELEKIHIQTINLVQQYDKYKVQFKKLAETQIEIISSGSFDISIANLEAFSYGEETSIKEQRNTFVEEKEEAPIIKEEIPIQKDEMENEMVVSFKSDSLKEEETEDEIVAIRKAELEEAASRMEKFMEEPSDDYETVDDFAETLSMENIFPNEMSYVEKPFIEKKEKEPEIKINRQENIRYSDVKYYKREDLPINIALNETSEPEETKEFDNTPPITRDYEDMTVDLEDEDFDFVRFED